MTLAALQAQAAVGEGRPCRPWCPLAVQKCANVKAGHVVAKLYDPNIFLFLFLWEYWHWHSIGLDTQHYLKNIQSFDTGLVRTGLVRSGLVLFRD